MKVKVFFMSSGRYHNRQDTIRFFISRLIVPYDLCNCELPKKLLTFDIMQWITFDCPRYIHRFFLYKTDSFMFDCQSAFCFSHQVQKLFKTSIEFVIWHVTDQTSEYIQRARYDHNLRIQLWEFSMRTLATGNFYFNQHLTNIGKRSDRSCDLCGKHMHSTEQYLCCNCPVFNQC